MESRLSTDQKGAIAESAIVHAAIRLRIGVLKPLTDGHRYDLVFDLAPDLVRVQCKWATLQRDVVSIGCYSCRRTRTGQLKRGYSPEEVDAIAAYCLDLDRCFYVPLECLGARRTLQLRLGLARNNQRKGINWAEEFAFERLRLGLPGAVAQLGERQSGTLEVRGSIPLGSTPSRERSLPPPRSEVPLENTQATDACGLELPVAGRGRAP
jgi:PD-(D/E)XK endonuclease